MVQHGRKNRINNGFLIRKEQKARVALFAFFGKAVPVALVGFALVFAGIFAKTDVAWAQKKDRKYILTTATTGGTYYPVGVAIATLVKVKLEPKEKISMSAISSAGSGENVKLLRENEAQFAILQGLYGHWAWSGTGKVTQSGKQRNMRSVTMLWRNVEHFIVRKSDARTGTIADIMALKGRPAALGKRTSGTFGSNSVILTNLGLNIGRDYELVYTGYNASVEAMQNNRVDLISTPGGPPVGAVSRLFGTMGDKVTLLEFTPDLIKKADGGLNLFTPFTIRAGLYPGLDRNIQTVAQPNFLAVNKDVPAEDVYRIIKTIYDNLPFLTAIHRATKAMSLDAAIAGLPAPLHPGAVRFYKEKGLKIPAHLVIN